MINKKFVITVASVFALIIVAAIVIIYIFADPWIENKIKNRLKSLENDSLSIAYKNLDVDLLSGEMALEGGSVKSSAGDNANFNFTIDAIRISGFDAISYVFNDKIVLDRVKIQAPNISYIMITKKDSVANNNSPVKLPDIIIKSIEIEDGAFSIMEKKDSLNTKVAEGKFRVAASDLAADSTAAHRHKYFDISALDVYVSDINYLMADSLHNLHIKSLSYSLNNGSMKVDSLHIQSLYEKYRLARVAGHELDWLDIYNPSITITGINTAFVNGFYDIDRMTIEGLDARLFRDKRLPYPDKPDSKLLHQIMESMTSSINIDTIELKKASIEYQEHVEESEKPGVVLFNNLYATFYNLTNVDSIAKAVDYTAHLDAQCDVMGRSLLKASFSFPLRASEQPYTVSGNLKDMDLTAFNPMLEQVAFVSIEKGQLLDLDFKFHYNTEQSNGKMAFAYEDLKINTLNKETNNSKGTGQDIKSFIANLLILKKNNLPDKDDFRVGEIAFTRNKKKSIFNYWWKSLLTGFRSSTGLTAPKKTVEEE